MTFQYATEQQKQDRLEAMKSMRFDKGKTMQQIADQFGLSRERVRQILGNTGWIASQENLYLPRKRVTQQRRQEKIDLIAQYDSPNQTTRALQEQTGLRYGLVSALRPCKRHVIDNPLCREGQRAEELVSKILNENNILNTLMSNSCHFDILLENGKTIDVKSRTHPTPGVSSENFYFFVCVRARKHDKPLPDFWALVIHEDIFIVPQTAMLPCGAIGFVWPATKRYKWQQYHNRFDLLLK
jgi:hypothetical protein